jgi:hypothetical protein
VDLRFADCTKLILQSSLLELSHPVTQRRVCPPPPFSPLVMGGTYLLAGEGVEDPNSDEGTDIVVLWVYMYVVSGKLVFFFFFQYCIPSGHNR